jgi:hypothetical protein
VLAVGAGCIAIAGYGVGVLGRSKCPACGTKLLVRVGSFDRDATVRAEGGVRLFACESCMGQFVRRDKGPYVPRHLWEQGNEGLPAAKLLDR